MNKNIFWVLLIASLLTACANNPKLSNEEYKTLINREYIGVTKDQVLQAAEELLHLADGDDFKIVKSPESLSATRRWHQYIVVSYEWGDDHWNVKTYPMNNNITVAVQISRKVGYSGNVAYLSLNHPDAIVDGTAIYDLFWARMDYLLGKRKDWMTCEMSDNRIKEKIVWGSNAPLCHMLNIKDNKPTSPIVTSN